MPLFFPDISLAKPCLFPRKMKERSTISNLSFHFLLRPRINGFQNPPPSHIFGLLTGGTLQGGVSFIPVQLVCIRGHLWSSETWQHQHKDLNTNRTMVLPHSSPGNPYRGDGHTCLVCLVQNHLLEQQLQVTGQPEGERGVVSTLSIFPPGV